MNEMMSWLSDELKEAVVALPTLPPGTASGFGFQSYDEIWQHPLVPNEVEGLMGPLEDFDRFVCAQSQYTNGQPRDGSHYDQSQLEWACMCPPAIASSMSQDHSVQQQCSAADELNQGLLTASCHLQAERSVETNTFQVRVWHRLSYLLSALCS